MQRMAEVLRSMTSLNSPSIASPSTSFENPIEEPISFMTGIHSPSSSSNSNVSTDPNNSGRDDIDFVTYESLGRSESQHDNQIENMDSGVEENSVHYSDDRLDNLPHRNRQDSEQSSNGFSILRFSYFCFVFIYLFINRIHSTEIRIFKGIPWQVTNILTSTE